MSGFLKFLGGVTVLGAIGIGVYLVLTDQKEEGLAHDIKAAAKEIVDEGKKAAEQRRLELQTELGQRPPVDPTLN